MSQFVSRPRVGTLFELLVLHRVILNFPGFRLFLVLPLVPMVKVIHGVRNFFFVFLMVGYLLGCPAPESWYSPSWLGLPGRRPDSSLSRSRARSNSPD